MSVRAVVFDFDGVIANSEPLHFRAFRDVLATVGVSLVEREYYDRYLGYDDAGAFAAVAADRGIQWTAAEHAALILRKALHMEALEQEQSVLFPGARTAIERLASEGPLAIASGALRAEIVRVLEREHLAQYFRTIVAAGDTAAGKPAPDPYLRAVAQLAASVGHPLLPGECVAVEDSRWGLESAKAAGLLTIGVTHTYAAAELQLATAVVAGLDGLTWPYLRGLR